MKMTLLDNLLKRKKSYIGMDIGSYAVKTVELSREKDNFKIRNLAYIKVKKPDSKDSLIQAIKESSGKVGTLNKEVSVAVSGPSVIIRFVELPHMTEDELQNAISFEAEKYIPFNIDEVIIDHQLLIPRLGDENKMLVLMAAAKKDFVNERLNLLSEAGLSVGILDVASFANVNAFLMNTAKKEDKIVALVDIGAEVTDINIIDGGILYFTRCIQLGGSDITKALSEALSIDLERAEGIKINPADRASEINEKINTILHNIIDEIRLSFSYYENQSGKSIQRAYLAGGGSRITNFYNMVRENLGVEATPWDPIGHMELDPSVDNQLITSIKDRLGVAMGLALR